MTRGAQLFLTVSFLLLVFGVPATQLGVDVVDGEVPQALDLFRQAPTEKNLRAYETGLDDNSVVVQAVRPVFQLGRYLLVRDLGEKAVAGNDGWYFYQPGVRYLSEPYFRLQPGSVVEGGDPVAVISDFAAQLRRRNIELLVMPAPNKESIYPDRLRAGVRPVPEIHANTTRFVDELRAAGVQVFDLHVLLAAARAAADQRGELLYMRTDTHWTGAGIKVAAAALAARVRAMAWYQQLPASASAPASTSASASTSAPASAASAGGPRYQRRSVELKRHGDVPRMTQIPLIERFVAEEAVSVGQVSDTISGEPFKTDPASPILFLGDSFARVFETDAPQASGIIANLGYELQLPIAAIVNDGGSSTLVRQQLARSPELLDGKRLVIWEFVERDVRLGLKGWQQIQLTPN